VFESLSAASTLTSSGERITTITATAAAAQLAGLRAQDRVRGPLYCFRTDFGYASACAPSSTAEITQPNLHGTWYRNSKLVRLAAKLVFVACRINGDAGARSPHGSG
jgi:hypothetical protein